MHRQIYRCIRDRKPESARDAMREHLLHTKKAQESELMNHPSENENNSNGDVTKAKAKVVKRLNKDK
jgi:hypothetical protein